MEESAEITFLDTLPDKIPDKIDDYRVIVDNAIASELRRREGSPFFEPLTYALRGGKRLRSVLLLLAFQSVAGGQNIHGFRNSMRDPLPAAVAMEVIHSGSIMIDDIIDEDLTRRDIDAFHASYGLKISLLNELMLLSLVLDMAASLDHRVARVLAKALSSLGTGAFEELAVYTTKQPIGAREYINILNKKTAFLFEASAMTGALVAGARENEIDALSDYGRLLGLAYQIQDDIVDWEEEPSRSLLSFLDGKSKDEKYLQELSTSFIVEAKQRLQELKSSEAKNRLIELADSVGMHSSNRI